MHCGRHNAQWLHLREQDKRVRTPAVPRRVVGALGDVGVLPGVKPSFAAAASPTGCSSLPCADWRAAPGAVTAQRLPPQNARTTPK